MVSKNLDGHALTDRHDQT